MTGLWPRRVLPVLMYHRLGSAADEDPAGDPALWIEPGRFARQLDRIAARGLRTLTLDEAFDLWRDGRAPRGAVLLTFDDAFAETLARAAPLLAERGMTAAAFAPAGLLGETVRLDALYGGAAAGTTGRIAAASELAAWIAAGHDVGSHSLTHADLAGLDGAALERELVESRRLLESRLERPVPDFCYPYARHDRGARAAAARAGYRAAYAGEPPRADLMALPRMMVYPGDGAARFDRKLSGYYYWFSAWHRRLAGRRRR